MPNETPKKPAPEFPIQTIEFVQVEEPTFVAEYALCDEDIVFHFFAPEGGGAPYWTTEFPSILEPVAKEVFRADFPRIRAMHIVEPDLGIDSWWFRAYGFGRRLNPRGLADRFLTRLGEALAARR